MEIIEKSHKKVRPIDSRREALSNLGIIPIKKTMA
jgi:hypothetical protein